MVALCDTVPERAKRRAQEWDDWRLGFDGTAADEVGGLLEGREPAPDVQAAKRMLQVPLAIYESGRTGRRVAPESVTRRLAGKMLGRLRAIVKEADPEVVEEWKWRGVPVWSHDGLICTGETYKNVVKMTFTKGAALKDPSGTQGVPSISTRARR